MSYTGLNPKILDQSSIKIRVLFGGVIPQNNELSLNQGTEHFIHLT